MRGFIQLEDTGSAAVFWQIPRQKLLEKNADSGKIANL
jgi:hypothetical protein